jgi:hypothetical protein
VLFFANVHAAPRPNRLAKQHAPGVSVMVSAIEPEAFGPAVEAGVDMLELGNFDSFYEQGLRLSSLDILDLTLRTRALYPRLPLSITVPHVLPMDEQVRTDQMYCTAGCLWALADVCVYMYVDRWPWRSPWSSWAWT